MRWGRRVAWPERIALASIVCAIVPLARGQASEIHRRADGTPIVTRANMHQVDYAEELRALAVRAQGNPDVAAGEAGWDAFIRAGSAWQNACKEFQNARGLDSRVDGIDFDELYAPTPDSDEAEAIRLEAKRRHTREFLSSDAAGEIDKLLDALATHEHAVRWKLGGEAHRAYAAEKGEPMAEMPGPCFVMPFFEIGAGRGIGRFCAARLHLAGEQGDWDRVVRWTRNGWAVARVLRGQTTIFIERTAGNGVGCLVAKRLLDLMERTKVPDATLAALSRAEREILQDAPGVARVVEGERMLMIEACGSVFARDGTVDEAGVERLFEKDAGGMKIALAVWPDAGFVMERVNEVFDDYQRFAALAPAGRDPAALLVERMREHTDIRNTLVQVLAPPLQETVHQETAAVCAMAALRAVLSIERFDRLHARLPATWDEVRQSGIECDSIDPYSGEAMRFVARGHEGGYIVYSVGLDGHDDGGIEDAKQPRRAIEWGAEPGLDYVIAEIKRDREPTR